MFGMDSVGKYSVQNWDIYRLESGATTPPEGGGRLGYWMVKHILTIDGVPL